MARLDRDSNVVVLRIVYDGPAGVGKTTTVKSLSAQLGRPTTTPEQTGERTVFFDWLDYTGGLFEGYQLRCQVVSVPGQAMLEARRNYLVSTADVVVYVAHATDETLPDIVGALRGLSERLGDDPVPPTVLLHANKRDLGGFASITRIRAALRGVGLSPTVIETVATEGSGVREGFVLAVRFALDRVRELIRLGRLEEGRPEVDSPLELLDRLRADEASPMVDGSGPPTLAEAVTPRRPSSPLEAALVEVLRSETRGALSREASPAHADRAEPRLPDPNTTPSGHIWPPIGGRAILAAATESAVSLGTHPNGWLGSTSGTSPEEQGWIFFSPRSGSFATAAGGRGALIQQARGHAAHQRFLSRDRVVVLAPDYDGRWRLWQIARRFPTLRGTLADSLDVVDPRRIAEILLDVAWPLLDLDERMARLSPRSVTLSVDTVGVVDGVATYVGLFPYLGPDYAAPRLDLAEELAPVLRDWRQHGPELADALRSVDLRSGMRADQVDDVLAALDVEA